MREIKFRGLSFGGVWYYYEKGSLSEFFLLLEHKDCDEIIRAETVGEYTGLKDKNGKDIFEGDILRLDTWTGLQVVDFIDGAFCLVNCGKNKGFASDIHYIHHAGIPQAEVVGNIFDNKEMTV